MTAEQLGLKTHATADYGLDLSDDERIIEAQRKLNEVRRYYEERSGQQDDFGRGRLREIRNTLQEAGLLLTLAEFDDIEPVTETIRNISLWLDAVDGMDETERALQRYSVHCDLYRAATVDPAREL